MWTLAADLAGKRWATLAYPIVLGTNVAAILAGVLLGKQIGDLASGSEALTAGLAGLLTFVSLGFALRLHETLPPPRQETAHQARPAIEALKLLSGLTPREF